MDRKKKFLVSSTPHLGRSRQLLNLFSDIQCSPINVEEPSKLHPIKEVLDHKPMPSSSSTKEQTKAEAGKKRRIIRKAKDPPSADPESATTGVLKELGVDLQDVRDNGLSHSRNLYNMFPEPIILDSDEENSVVEKRSVKKPRQNSKVIQSTTTQNQEEKKRKDCLPGSKVIQSTTTQNQEEKKSKERLPGSSRSLRSSRAVADRRAKKQAVTQTVTKDPASLKNLKPHSRSKLPTNQECSDSVVLLEDNENDDFPVYIPGTDLCTSKIKTKAENNVRLSLDLDDKFPIEWGSKPKKPTVIEDSQAHECSPKIEKNNNRKGLVEATNLVQNKVACTEDISNTAKPKFSHASRQNKDTITMKNLNVETKKRAKQKAVGSAKKLIVFEQNGNDSDDKKEEDKVMISHFENIVFKQRSNGGIIARCLQTNENDVGYLEVPKNEVFSGETKNIAFVVIEGKAKATHLGTQHTLVPGDIINIIQDGGYTFESCGSNHVRFLYIKPR